MDEPAGQRVGGRRRVRVERAGHARMLTFSCQGRAPLMGEEWVRDVFAERLRESRERLGFGLHGWVVMPEHVHLLVRVREGGGGGVLQDIKEHTARRVLCAWRKGGSEWLQRCVDSRGKARFWMRGGGHDRNVFSERAVRETIEYMHANPVRRGLVKTPTDWKWSSARWYVGTRDGELEMDPIGAWPPDSPPPGPRHTEITGGSSWPPASP